MPVATPTTVRIPLPAETQGSGLAAMLGSARANARSTAAPSTALVSPSPGAGDDAVAAAPANRPDGPKPSTPTNSTALDARSAPRESKSVNHNDPQLAANNKFTLDERGRVVPAGSKPPTDRRAPDPDNFEVLEDDEAPKAETPETPEVKPEAKVEPKPEAKVETPTEPEVKEPLAFTQTTRDYSIFDPADVDALKKLPNAAFNRLRDRFVESKKIKDELDTLKKEVSSRPKEPTYLYEHPEGYMLQPEFTQLLTQEDNSNQIVNFYAEQLSKASEGEDFQFINEQGQVQTVKLNGRVNSRANSLLQIELNKYVQMQQQAKQAVQQFQHRYKQGVATVGQQLKQLEDKFFPGFDEAKLSPEDKATYDYAYQITPEPLRNSPQTRLLAKAYVEFARLSVTSTARIAELEKQLAALKPKSLPTPTPAGQGSVETVVPYEPED